VIRKHLGRIATALTTAALLGAMVGAAPVSAANPTWTVSFNKLPTSVSAGNDAGWFVTVTNTGPSNINDLNIGLTSEVAGALPSYLSDLFLSSGGTETCSTATGAMVCNVGTLGDDQYVTFTVAFHVPTGTSGSFDLNVGLRAGTGDTETDTPGKSRGDKKTFTSSTGITSSINQDAGFVAGDDANDGSFQTTGSLGRNNKQTTALDTTDLHIPVTVTDGVNDYPCNLCSNLVGEWSILDVNGGINTNPIKVTLLVWGGSVPGGVGEADLYLLHADGLGGYTTITQDDNTCNASPPTNADCIESVTKVGSNFRIVAWLAHNGGLRGGY
jgi:hypothetical protein